MDAHGKKNRIWLFLLTRVILFCVDPGGTPCALYSSQQAHVSRHTLRSQKQSCTNRTKACKLPSRLDSPFVHKKIKIKYVRKANVT